MMRCRFRELPLFPLLNGFVFVLYRFMIMKLVRSKVSVENKQVFNLFKKNRTVHSDFHQQKPIVLSVSGNFCHDFRIFFLLFNVRTVSIFRGISDFFYVTWVQIKSFPIDPIIKIPTPTHHFTTS